MGGNRSINMEKFNYPSHFKKPNMDKTILESLIEAHDGIHGQSIAKEHSGKKLLTVIVSLLKRNHSLDEKINPLLDSNGNVKPLKTSK